MLFLRDYLKAKGIAFKITSRRTPYTEQELFAEMERIWKILRQRPSRYEWEQSSPKISYQTYKYRFGSWTNACLKFIEYKSGKAVFVEDEPKVNLDSKKILGKENNKKDEVTPIRRDVSLSLRLKVLSRDNFRCVYCGKSPVTDLGTKLHIDHIIPFSKGGKSELNNSQTLCEECNLGKSNRVVINMVK